MQRHLLAKRWAAFAIVAMTLAPAVHANRYTLVDLGRHHDARQINSSGEIAGIYESRVAMQEALVRRDGHWQHLSKHGGWAVAIDDEGTTAGNDDSAPVLWPRTGDRRTFTLPNGATVGGAVGISNGRVIGGYLPAGGGSQRCFLGSTAGGATADLGTMAHSDNCTPAAINATGQVAGYASPKQEGWSHAFLWDGGAFQDLGVLPGGGPSFAYALNAAGQVVGYSTTSEPGVSHAILWSGGVMNDLGAGGAFERSTALAINDRGEIVGMASNAGDRQTHAVRFADGTMIPLDTEVDGLAHWRLERAYGISQDGVIVGWGHHDGHRHGFMLVPQADR